MKSDSGQPFLQPESDVRPSARPGWNGLEIPGRPEPQLPPGRHVRNIPFQNGMYQPAQSFLSLAASDWTDGITPMAFTVWLSCWTSQQLPDGLMVMKKDGGNEGKLTFVSPVTVCNSSDDFKPGGFVSPAGNSYSSYERSPDLTAFNSSG